MGKGNNAYRKATQIIIIDLGSQNTQIIRRSLRYLGFHSTIVAPEKSPEWVKENKPKGIILSGGTMNISDADAPQIPKEILDFNIPILGICLGMQWLAHVYDKNSIQAVPEGKSYGPVKINLEKSKIFEN